MSSKKGGGPPPDRARALTVDELVEHVGRLFNRLDDHCHAYLVEGKVYRIADVAAVLRTLISRQTHDNMLPTLFKRLRFPEPLVFVSPPPSTSQRAHLSWGSMPVHDVVEGGGWDRLSISDLQVRRVVVMGPEDGFARIDQTWAKFVADYGNTWGAHVSSTVPLYLDRTEIRAGAEIPLGHSLLLALADALLDAMAAIEWPYRDRFARSAAIPFVDSPVVGATVIEESHFKLNVVPTLSYMPSDAVVLLTTDYQGQRLTVRTVVEDGAVRLSFSWADRSDGLSPPLTPRPLSLTAAIQRGWPTANS